MPTRKSEKPVVVEPLVKREEGKLEVPVVFSKKLAAQLQASFGNKLQPVLEKAFRTAVLGLGGRSKRISAHVPRSLAQRFDVYCRNRGGSMSGALQPRISRYVDQKGTLLKTSYGNTRPLPPPKERDDKKVVQVTVPARQAKGFDSFCRKVAVQKDTFFMREMLLLLERAAQAEAKRAQKAADGRPEGSPA